MKHLALLTHALAFAAGQLTTLLAIYFCRGTKRDRGGRP